MNKKLHVQEYSILFSYKKQSMIHPNRCLKAKPMFEGLVGEPTYIQATSYRIPFAHWMLTLLRRYGIEYATMPTACMTYPETILAATWPASHSSGTDHCRLSGSQLCSAVPPLGLAGGRTRHFDEHQVGHCSAESSCWIASFLFEHHPPQLHQPCPWQSASA